MADTNLGTARGEVVIDYDGKGVDQAEKGLQRVDKAGQQAEAGVTKAGNAMGIAGLAIAGGIAVAVNSAANFEQRMSAVEAVSGATGAEMSKLSALALQLGKDTAFSATDAASAIEELVKAGISVPDVMNGAAQATVALAAAGEVALPQAAELAANAMNAFNLSAQDMPKVADLIAGAANASAIDVSQFGQSLQQVGAVANLAGVSFDDTAAAIALLGNAGIKGSDAGTSLKTMFQNLIPTTEKQKDLMRDLGIVTEDGSNKFFDAQGNVKNLADVSQVLQNSLKGMTKEQKLATLETLFGSDAIRGAAILADNGAKGFDNMAKSMGKVTAEGVAAKRLDNVKGSLEQLKGSLETAGIAVGTILLPAIRKLVDGFTSLLNKFLALSPETQKLILMAIGITGGFLLFAAAALKIGAAIKGLVGFLRLAGGAMKALNLIFAANPIGLIIIAIGLLVLGIILLWKRSETFRNIVMAVWNTIKGVILVTVNWILNTAVPFLQKAWDAIVSGVSAAVGWVRRNWKLLISIILGPLGVIVALVITHWSKIKAFITAAVNAVKSAVTRAWNAISSTNRAIWNAVKNAVTTAWNAIKSAISRGVSAAMSIVRSFKSKIVGFFSGAGSWLTSAGRAIIDGLARGVRAAGERVIAAARAIVQKVKDLVPGSPVQDGPLKVLNHGHAGKEIIRMLARGIESEQSTLQKAMQSVVGATSLGNSVRLGEVGTGTWEALKAAGWRGNPHDGMEALHRPGTGGITVQNLEVKAYTDRFRLKQVQEELALHGAV